MIIINIGRGSFRSNIGMWKYAVANQILMIDREVSTLAPYFTEINSEETARWQSPFMSEGENAFSGRQITGWVAGSLRTVTCHLVVGKGYRIAVEGVGIFAIEEDGSTVAFEHPEVHQTNEGIIIETALGPMLIIALAAKGVFCLHSSAVLVRGCAFVFLGDSGTGKSTLASYLANRDETGHRIADDILPIMAKSDGTMALPRFPQLKLPANQQIGPDIPDQISVFGGIVRADNC